MHSFKKEIQPHTYPADKNLFEEAKKLIPMFQAAAIHNGQSISANGLP